MKKSAKQPNIILIMTDQHRGDCLGIEGHRVLQTPCLDWLAASGARFGHAYTACPVCVPARRTLMSGKKPVNHGVVHNYDTLLEGPTLPEVLRDNGYQTHLSGKLHLWPLRKSYGFEGMELSDGPGASRFEGDSDYIRFLKRENVKGLHPQGAHGVASNSLRVRPWHLDERYHVANWATEQAIEFLETRDPTRPFFLKVSYFHPHPPLTPPEWYYNFYVNQELPQPIEADWSRLYNEACFGGCPDPSAERGGWNTLLPKAVQHQFQAAYYAAIHHIDDQIQRLFNAFGFIEGLDLNETAIVFCSDHGDMAGDHQLFAKCLPYEGSMRVPFIVRTPQSSGSPKGRVIDQPVELMDIMPTILDMAGLKPPDSVDGRSVIPLIQGETDDWREYVHGEICDIQSASTGMHYLTDGQRKYAWFPGLGTEQFFDLERDPCEVNDLADEPSRADEITLWRQRLIRELDGRPEKFTDGKSLLKLDGPTPAVLPGFERRDS